MAENEEKKVVAQTEPEVVEKVMSADEVLKKYDKESDKRTMTGIWNHIINVICIAFAIFSIKVVAPHTGCAD